MEYGGQLNILYALLDGKEVIIDERVCRLFHGGEQVNNIGSVNTVPNGRFWMGTKMSSDREGDVWVAYDISLCDLLESNTRITI